MTGSSSDWPSDASSDRDETQPELSPAASDSSSVATGPLFTVAIPVYNRADLVGKTIESVFAQTFDDYEIVCVNDGSSDDSLSVLRSYEPRVRVIDQENKGLSGARNAGAEHAQGEYLLFLDSDDLLFPWSLEVMAEAIRKHDRPAMVSGVFPPFDNEADLASHVKTAPRMRAFKDYLSTRARKTGVAPSGTAVLADAYRETGASDDVRVMFEDVDIWFKVGARPGYVHIDEPPIVGYRVGHAQMMGNMKKQLDGFDWIEGKVERGEYPTGHARKKEMQDALALHAKSCAIRCLHAGDRGRGWAFYRRTLGAQIRNGEWKFVLAYPMLWLTGKGVAAKQMRDRKKQVVTDG
ncbi:MAG: glycosyltransferase family 2 protein [Planctomycetota bacterium]